jgi:nucleotide-binding universal stress UspA family protein
MSHGVFERILVPTDFSPCARAAWQLAQRLASVSGSELILVHVIVRGTVWGESPFNADRMRELFGDVDRRAERELDEWAAEARAAWLPVAVRIREGSAHEEIVELARDRAADLIVIGTHGRGGAKRALLGSVADKVVRLAPCPVLTVRGDA